MSTGEDGKILVDDGRGSIDVINRSTSELVINDLNAGSQSTGVIRITDLNKTRLKGGTTNQYENFSEWYIHEPGKKIKQYVTSASETTYTGVSGTEVGYTENGKQTYKYQPKKGQLYYVVQREDIKREVNWPEKDAGWVSTYNPLTAWKYDNDNPNVAEWEKWYEGFTSCQNVSAVSCNSDGSVSTYLTHILDDRYVWNTGWSSYTTSYSNYYGKDFTSVTWRIDVPYRIGMKATTYVKADHQIKFQFVGADKGSLDIKSRSDVTLAGNINNSVGTTKVSINRSLGSKGSTNDTGGIYMSDTGILNSEKTYLDAVGSLGTNNRSLRMITDHISAVARNGLVNINMTAASGAISVEKLQAASNLTVNVDKGLTPYGTGLHLKGNNINITSEFGGIGDVSGNKVMNLSSTGLVTLKATGDIALNQSSGNLTVNTIESDAGDIWITLGNGHLVNGIGQKRYTDEELAYQATVWDRLNLRSDSAGEEAVHGYENQVSSQYHSYWRIKQRLTDDAEFTIDDTYLDAFKQRYKSRQDALNGTDLDLASITREQVTTNLKTEFDAINQWLADEKTSGNLTADYGFGDSYNGGYRFDIADNSELYNKLTADARWTDTQLEIAISAAATQPVTDGYISGRNANISGNNIRLNINQGRVGEDLADLDFDISRSNPNLSNTQKAALLEAGSGDLDISDNGSTIAVSVKQQDPIKINADGHVTLVAGKQIYVESDQGMTLKQVSTPGDVRLAASGAIESASGSSTTIAANNLNLSTKSGHIGTETDPIRLDIEGALRSVASPSDIWLNHVGGHLQVGAIGAGGLLNLQANGNISNWSENGDNVHLKANGAVIVATNGGNIGASNRALKLNLTGGTLKLEGASAWMEVNSSAPIDIAAVNLTGLLDFDTAGDVNLSGNLSAGNVDMDVTGAVAAIENLSLMTTGNLNILAGTLDTRKAAINSGSAYLETSGGQFDSGKITSTSGILTLLASGDLALYDKVDAKKALLLDAQSIAMMQGSSIRARETATLTAVAALDLRSITSNDTLSLTAPAITLNEKVEGKTGAAFDINAANQLTVKSGQLVKAAGNIDIDAGTIVMEGNSRLESGAALLIDTSSLGMTLAQLQAANMGLNSAAGINLNETVNVTGVAGLMAVNDIVLAAGQTMTTGGNAVLKATTIQTNAGSTLDANADLTLRTSGSQTLATLGVDGTLKVAGLLDGDNSGGPVAFNENVTVLGRTEVDTSSLATLKTGRTFKSTQLMVLNSDSFSMEAGSKLDTEAGLTITTDNNQQLAQLDVAGLATLTSNNGSISFNEQAQTGSATIKALLGDVAIAENQQLSSRAGLLDIDAATLTAAAGSTLKSEGNTDLQTTGAMQLHHVDSEADILATSGNTLTVNGNTLTVNGNIDAVTDIDLNSDDDMLLQGSITSGGTTDLNSKADITINGILNAGADLIAHSSGRFTSTETLTAANNINLNNMGGLVRFDADVTATGGNLVFTGNDSLQINGNLTTGNAVNIQALQGDVSLAANKTLDSGSTTAINSGSVTFAAASILETDDAVSVITSGATQLHHIDSGASLTIDAGENLTVNGTVNAVTFIDLDSDQAITLQDTVTSGTRIDINSGSNTVINGNLNAGSGLKVNSGAGYTQNAAVIAEGDITLKTVNAAVLNSTLTSNTGNFLFEAGDSLQFNDDVDIKTGSFTATITNDLSLAGSKTIHSGTDSIVKSATVISMGDNSQWNADGKLDLTTFANQSLATLNVGSMLESESTGGSVAFRETATVTGSVQVDALAGDVSLNDSQLIDSGSTLTINSGSITVADNATFKATDTINLTASDTMQLHHVQSDADIIATSGNTLTVNGDISAGTDIDLNSDNNMLLEGSITAGGNTELDSKADITINGILNTGADLIAHTSGRFISTETLTATNNISLNNIGGLVRFDAGVTATGGSLVFTGNDSLQVNGNLTTDGAVNIQALQGDVSLAADKTLDSGSTVTITSGSVTFADNSTLNAQGVIGVTTSGATQLHHIDGEQSVTINAGDTLTVNGTVDSGSFIDLDSGAALTLNDAVTAGTNIDINSLQTAVLNGITNAGGSFTATTADSLTFNDTLTATGNITLDSGGDTEANATVISETGNLTFRGDSSLRLNDNVTIAGTVDITALQGDVSLAAGKKLNSSSMTTINSGSVTFDADSTLEAGEMISVITSGATRLHHIDAAQSVTINGGDTLTVTGTVEAGTSVDLDSGNDMLLEYTVTVGTTLDANSLGLLTVNGTVNAASDIGFDSVGQAALNADIISNTGSFSFRGDDGLTINRNITTQGAITLNSADETTLAADQALVSETLSIDADSFSMGQGSRTETRDNTRIHTRGDMLLSALEAKRDGERAFDLESREGQILGRSDADVHLTATQPNASGFLQAATGIGDPLVIDMPYLSAVTDDGDIYMVARSDLHARLLSAINGNIYLTTLGNLTIDELLGNPWLLVDGFLAADKMTFDRGILAARNGTNVTEITLTDTGPLSLFAPQIDVTLYANNQAEVLMPVVTDFDWDTHETSDIKAFIDAGVPQLRQSEQLRLMVFDTNQLHVNILQAVNGRVQTTGDMLLDLADSDETLDLVTGDLHVNLDNLNPGAKPTETQADNTVTAVDGQLMTPFGVFWIQMDGVNVTTNAQFTRYQPPLLLTYKAPTDQATVSAGPESFFRLSAEYQNGISNQIDSSGGGFASYINDPLPEELLLAIGDDWLGNLEVTAAGGEADTGQQTNDDENYWLYTGTDSE